MHGIFVRRFLELCEDVERLDPRDVAEHSNVLQRCKELAKTKITPADRQRLQSFANDLVHRIVRAHGPSEPSILPPARVASVSLPNLVPSFTGRQAVRDTVHRLLEQHQPVALCGEGGMGKTQIAVKYYWQALRSRGFEGVVWARGETEWDQLESYHSAARQLGITQELDMFDHTAARDAVHEHLKNNTGWLIIVDDAFDPDRVYASWLPDGCLGNGSVLMTTRRDAASLRGGPIHPIEVGPLSVEEASQFFKRCVPDELYSSESDREESPKLFEGLAERLARYPLALDQAAYTIIARAKEQGPGVMAAVQWYQGLLERDFESAIGSISRENPHISSLQATLSVAFECLGRLGTDESKYAVQVLQYTCLVSSEPLPSEFFHEDLLEPPLAAEALKKGVLPVAAEESLVHLGSGSVQMHPLVQEILRRRMEDADRKRKLNRVVDRLKGLFPSYRDVDTKWQEYAKWFAHVVSVANLIVTWDHRSAPAARLLHEAAQFSSNERAIVADARRWLERAIEIRLELCGEDGSSGGPATRSGCSPYDLAESIRVLGGVFEDGFSIGEVVSPRVRQKLDEAAGSTSRADGPDGREWGALGTALHCCLWARQLEKRLEPDSGADSRQQAIKRRNGNLLGRLYRAMGHIGEAEKAFGEGYASLPSGDSAQSVLSQIKGGEASMSAKGWSLIRKARSLEWEANDPERKGHLREGASKLIEGATRLQEGLECLAAAYESLRQRYGKEGDAKELHSRTLDRLCELAAALTELGVDSLADHPQGGLWSAVDDSWWRRFSSSLGWPTVDKCWEEMGKSAKVSHKNKRYLVRATVGRGELARRRGQGGEAKKLFEDALITAKAIENYLDQAMVHDSLRQLYQDKLAPGDPNVEATSARKLLAELGIQDEKKQDTLLLHLRQLYPPLSSVG